MTTLPPIWAIIPAAGCSRRMQSATPKQYLPLLESTVIEHTLSKLLALPIIQGLIVVVHEQDAHWDSLALASHPKIHRVYGGAERCDSVLNGLQYCLTLTGKENAGNHPAWALVHDAARPCVTPNKIEELVTTAINQADHYDGAILAVRACDTIKRVDPANTILHTEDRSQLWFAHTPQFFPARRLLDALLYCREKNLPVTDEASAIEFIGGRVTVVADRRDNVKVTLPEDLLWAATLLKSS